jgi:hypothetical protein
MIERKSIFVFWISVLLIAIAVFCWLGYVGNAMAYGDVLGLPGRDSDLATYHSRAIGFLLIALCGQGSAVAVVTWMVGLRERPTWVRFCLAVGVAAFSDSCVLLIMRGH